MLYLDLLLTELLANFFLLAQITLNPREQTGIERGWAYVCTDLSLVLGNSLSTTSRNRGRPVRSDAEGLGIAHFAWGYHDSTCH